MNRNVDFVLQSQRHKIIINLKYFFKKSVHCSLVYPCASFSNFNFWSYSINNFEFAEFSGKYDFAQHCKLQSQFFDASLLVSKDKKEPCKSKGRYSVGSSELLKDMQDTHLPTKIGIPVVEGNAAAIEVITDLRSMLQPEDVGRIVFFLNKTNVGWRIVNNLAFENWPITDGKCWGEFKLPPSPWQKQFEAPQCKPGFVDQEIH